MPLTLERIAGLRRVEIGRFGPHEPLPPCTTSEEMIELLDAAEAWELWQTHACQDALGVFISIGWEFDPSYGGQLSFGPPSTFGPHPMPQAAVLAALGPTGESDVPKG